MPVNVTHAAHPRHSLSVSELHMKMRPPVTHCKKSAHPDPSVSGTGGAGDDGCECGGGGAGDTGG